MITEGVDYSFGRPNLAELKTAGKHFACRYLSGGHSGKDITFLEAQDLGAAGIDVVLVWESGKMRALDGRLAGRSDAATARTQATSVGCPDTAPIYFAVDFQPTTAQLPAVVDYFAGADEILSAARVGVYAGLGAVKAVLNSGHAAWAWQTYGWSGGVWDPRAQIQQYHNGVAVAGATVDLDRATVADYGGWTPQGASDMSAADVAAINAHTDAAFAAFTGIAGNWFSSLSHGHKVDGTPFGNGIDTVLAAIKAEAGPAGAAIDYKALAAELAPLIAPAVLAVLTAHPLVPKP